MKNNMKRVFKTITGTIKESAEIFIKEMKVWDIEIDVDDCITKNTIANKFDFVDICVIRESFANYLLDVHKSRRYEKLTVVADYDTFVKAVIRAYVVNMYDIDKVLFYRVINKYYFDDIVELLEAMCLPTE